ncbi:hypothetical protein M0805_000494 [Coniferiporia weirii]|nr:hypothetical protein M0805_000494 [Coniferiporia weirii]
MLDSAPTPAGVSLPLPLAIPAHLWRLYLDHLWHHQPNSWVASAASTFQLLACLVIVPFALLSLLDVTSYIIARTLGVVETTRASTSDKCLLDVYGGVDGEGTDGEPISEPEDTAHPSVLITPAPGGGGHVQAPQQAGGDEEMSLSPDDGGGVGGATAIATSAAASTPMPRFASKISIPAAQLPQALRTRGEPEACFFSPSDERNLALSGALFLSPAPSRQGSPTLERRRLQPVSGAGLAPGDSESFTTLGGESETDEGNSLSGLRRRGGVVGADDALVS